jgi:ferredoxin
VSRTLRIVLDEDLCKSSRNCVYRAPKTFELSETAGEATIVVTPPGDDEQAIIEAGLGCPQYAISVFDVETGEDLLESAVSESNVSWQTPGPHQN